MVYLSSVQNCVVSVLRAGNELEHGLLLHLSSVFFSSSYFHLAQIVLMMLSSVYKNKLLSPNPSSLLLGFS